MANFEVTAVELHVAGHALRTIADEGRTDLSRLGVRVEELVGSRWQGTAAARFAGGFADWRDAASEGVAALELMADLLEANGRDYTASDEGGASSLGRAGGSL